MILRRYFYPIVLAILALIAAVALGFNFKRSKSSPLREVVVRLGMIDYHISANGRTEGISEELKLGSKLPGRIKSILVEEGDPIKKGQLLAVLENDDARARMAMEKAALGKAQAHLELVLNGARAEEREAAHATVNEAQAVAENARITHQRIKNLYERGVLSKEQLDGAERDLKTAEAKLESLRQRHQLIVAPPRHEDVASARAEVAMVTAQLQEAEVNYEDTFIRSPIDGIILKKYMRPGESITFQSISMPLLSAADNSRILVRAEVDETDVSKVRVGQPALITAEAYRGEVFPGRVVRVSGGLGKKQLKSDNPTEKVDTEVLETIIELDQGAETRLKLGLRVDVVIRITYKENVLVLPAAAVYEKGNASYVRLKGGDDWTEQRVAVGLRDRVHVEITEGLKAGDVVSY